MKEEKVSGVFLTPGMHQREVSSEGNTRIYLVYVPKSDGAVTRLPVLMVLHGGGGSAAFASRVYGWRELSEREGCLVVFPEATLEVPTEPPSLRENPRIWNDGSTRSAVARRNVNDIGYLEAVFDDLEANFSIHADRVLVTGFSNGASMTFRVGIELSDRVTAVAPVSGHLCLKDPQPVRAVSMLYIIGLEDPLNPFAGGPTQTLWGEVRQKPPVMDSILTWVRLIEASEQAQLLHEDNGVKLTRYGPGMTGCEIQLCTIAGQGHEWPGARRTLPSILTGPQTEKMNATQAVWDFFRNLNLG